MDKKVPAKAVSKTAPKVALKLVEDPRIKAAREQYEAGLALLAHHKYERAAACFEKALQAPSIDLVERARMHITICTSRMDRKAPTIKTAEDHYNYAVAQSNAGKLADAEDHLLKAMKLSPRTGHLHYALAAVLAQRGQIDAALTNLRQAIDLDGHNRFLSRSDTDFNPLYEDPRFADLIYPDRMD